LQALVGNEPATDMWFGVLAGTVHPDEFFAPDNVARIMGSTEATARAS
jgi:hypothetical protein